METALLVLALVAALLAVALVVLVRQHAHERAALLAELRHAHNVAISRHAGEVAVLERAQADASSPSRPDPTPRDPSSLGPYLGE